MKYDIERICKYKNNSIETYEIFKMYGHGVIESPYEPGSVIKTVECTELEAFIIAESMNIELHGFIRNRSSWEEPMIRYRKINKL